MCTTATNTTATTTTTTTTTTITTSTTTITTTTSQTKGINVKLLWDVDGDVELIQNTICVFKSPKRMYQ